VTGALARLIAGQVLVLSVWFSAAAVLPGLAAAAGVAPAALAGLSTATQLGFVVGALALAITGLPDRRDPRLVFAAASVLAACANAALLLLPPDGWAAIGSRFVVGAALAGAYPVGMKIAVGWSLARRGLIVGALVGALTLGSAAPHGLAVLGGADAQLVVLGTSAAALLGAFLVAGCALGPHHARALAFRPRAALLAWRVPGIRWAYLGYFGHMWELYAFWAWVAVRAGAGGAPGSMVAVLAIGLGGLACLPAGWAADAWGRARIAEAAMWASAAAGLFAALMFGGAPWLFALALILWGIVIIPDSAQFSALVADAAPAEYAGSLMALQTALGFALSALTVQWLPAAASWWGWPAAMALLSLGPVCGALAMRRLGREAGRVGA